MKADKATNPQQYDTPEMNWEVLGSEEARQYFRDALDEFIETGSLTGKRVIDIGSGVGHLFGWLKTKGSLEVTGIDPAEKNIALSRQKYPWATSVVSTLENFAKQNELPFDTAIAILSFEHMQDLKAAFQDVSALLKAGGQFYLIIGDKNYHTSNDQEIRSGQFGSVEILKDLGDGTVETKTIRNLLNGQQSVMYDIFRPIEKVYKAAENSGFKLLTNKPLLNGHHTMMYVLGFVKQDI